MHNSSILQVSLLPTHVSTLTWWSPYEYHAFIIHVGLSVLQVNQWLVILAEAEDEDSSDDQA